MGRDKSFEVRRDDRATGFNQGRQKWSVALRVSAAAHREEDGARRPRHVGDGHIEEAAFVLERYPIHQSTLCDWRTAVKTDVSDVVNDGFRAFAADQRPVYTVATTADYHRPAMANRPLEATGISKRYGARAALDVVDLVVDRGVVHGLLGPNGAGKTTLLRILLGLVRPDSGEVRLLGQRLDRGAGGVPERVAGMVDVPAFYPYLSGRRNLQLLASLDGHRGATCATRVDDVLSEVGLAVDSSSLVRGYSAGMRQRLGLAAARLRTPDVLVLDEPTSSLDPRSAADIRRLIRRMADEGAAIVFSSHDMAEVEELCTTMTVIDAGRVLFSGSIARLQRRTSASVHVIRTSDDTAAAALACERDDLRLLSVEGDGLELTGDVAAMDAYVVALGRRGVAVRSLTTRQRSLESLFLELTSGSGAQRSNRLLSAEREDERRAELVS